MRFVISILDTDDTEQADLRGGRSPWFAAGRHTVRLDLAEDIKCDALIVGGGITGSLVAERLTRQGLDVVVIDRELPGHGSTAASTSMLLWEIDRSLTELTETHGFERASRAYLASLHAVAGLIWNSQDRFGLSGDAIIVVASSVGACKNVGRITRFGVACLTEDDVRLFLKDSTNHSIVALGFLLLTGPALAQSVGEKTGVNSALGISPTTADFVKEVAISDMFEVESNKLAQDKGNALERKFAAQMVTDHTKTSTELKGLVSSGKVKAELPVALDGSHQGKLDKLRGAGGKDFSLAFDSMQVSAHRDAVSLFERYSKRGDNTDLKNWAGKTLPALKHHLKMAQALKK